MRSRLTIFKTALNAAPLLALVALSGCDEAAQSNPTWTDDVQLQAQANCIRCHSYPARGGAPDNFRLDVYHNTRRMDGSVIHGAATMAEYTNIRAGVEGTMPPDFARGDLLRDTFINWFETGAAKGEHTNNTPPQVLLRNELPVADRDAITIEYEIRDPDGDSVHGRLRVGDRIVADDLHAGRGSVHIEPSSLPSGDHAIKAEVSDGSAGDMLDEQGAIATYATEQVIGTLSVLHPDGNTAPSIALARLLPPVPTQLPVADAPALTKPVSLSGQLINDAQSLPHLQIVLADPDADTHSLAIAAYRGSEEIEVASIAAATATTDYEWDSTAIPEGPGWRLRITATDSQGAATTLQSGAFYVSHASTTETFDAIAAVLRDNCASCHFPDGRVPNLDLAFDLDPPTADSSDEQKLRYEAAYYRLLPTGGNILKRAVLEQNMPPASAANLFADSPKQGVLSESDRAKLEGYLLGGSPR